MSWEKTMCQVNDNAYRNGLNQPQANWDSVSNLLGAASIRNDKVVCANDRFLKMIGRSRRDVCEGKVSMKSLIPPEYDLIFLRSMNILRADGSCPPFEMELLRHDSIRLPVFFALSLNKRDGVDGLTCFLFDMSRQKKAEQELQKVHDQLETRVLQRTAALARTVERMRQEITKRKSVETSLRRKSNQLRSLASQLTLAEHRERTKIASILHDQLQQLLVGASYRSAILARSNHPQVHKMANEINDLLASALKVSRSLTCELCPSVLAERGLIGGLNWLARWMHDKFGLIVNLVTTKAYDLSQPDEITILLFQSVRELLFNVVKHAHVLVADVHVTRLKKSLKIIVADKGQGFDVRRINRARKVKGMGLFGISERLAVMGGSMQIRTAPGKGSKFTLVAPIVNKFTDDHTGIYVSNTPSKTRSPSKATPNHHHIKPGQAHPTYLQT